MQTVKIRRINGGEANPLPAYATEFSAGMDLYAAGALPITVEPFNRVLVKTGISIELPSTLEAQVRPRSGLALKHGLTVLNSPGTIDADYRGEIGVILINLGQEAVTISRGDRIAQLVVAPVIQVKLEEVDELSGSARGEGGFGHTGVSNRGQS